MIRENVKTREDLAEYIVEELAVKKPNLTKEEVNKLLAAIFTVVKYDSSVAGFLRGYKV